MKGALLAAGLLAATATMAAAQPARYRGGQQAREELFKIVDAYVVSNLQESLGLSDQEFVKLLPPVRRLQSVRRDYAERRRERLGEMRRLLQSGAATEPRIAELMKELKAQEAEEPLAVRREVDAVDALLTPVQQAKLRLLEARVEQFLREVVRRGQRQGLGPRRGAPAAGEDPEGP